MSIAERVQFITDFKIRKTFVFVRTGMLLFPSNPPFYSPCSHEIRNYVDVSILMCLENTDYNRAT